MRVKLSHTQNAVIAKLKVGSDRTSGASINTGTETKNTAAANTNQVCLEEMDKGRDGDKQSVDSSSFMLCWPMPVECKFVSIAGVEEV
jgi:hypothetical protein